MNARVTKAGRAPNVHCTPHLWWTVLTQIRTYERISLQSSTEATTNYRSSMGQDDLSSYFKVNDYLCKLWRYLHNPAVKFTHEDMAVPSIIVIFGNIRDTLQVFLTAPIATVVRYNGSQEWPQGLWYWSPPRDNRQAVCFPTDLLSQTPGGGCWVLFSSGEPRGWSWWASTAAFHTLFLHSVNNFTSWENSNPIELCLFGHAPLILAKGQWLVQSTYPIQLYLMHLGKLSCTWLIQAQLDCAFKSPHSIRLCSGFVAWHLVTCRLRHKPKGNVLETVGFLASVYSTEFPRFHAVPLFPPLGAAE